MKLMNKDKLPQNVKSLYNEKTEEIPLYETLEEYLYCNNGVTDRAIEERIEKHVKEYNNLPDGEQKQKIDEAVKGMYIGMVPGQRYAEKNIFNYFREVALDELFKEERARRAEIISKAKPNDKDEAYFLLGYDYDKYERGPYVVAAATSVSVLEEIKKAATKFIANLSDLKSPDKALDINGKEVPLKGSQMGE